MAVNNSSAYATVHAVEAAFVASMQAIGYFENSPTIAIAVSGGSDSMALLYLAQDWAKKYQGRLVALTVNHNLRLESPFEARQVQTWCAALGIEHHILTWNAPPIHSSVQERARDARYHLLTTWCKQNYILHLLTAHHGDDQMETLFFRLARGSKLNGLACMPMVAQKQGIRLLRPLLAIPKHTLQSFLEYHNQPWLEDSSNQNTLYSRVRIRQQLATFDDYPELSSRSMHLIHCFAKHRANADTVLANQLHNYLTVTPFGTANLNIAKLVALPSHIVLNILSRLFMTVSGTAFAPRLNKLERFYQHCLKGQTRVNFHGCLWHYNEKSNQACIYREPHAIKSVLPINAARSYYWDNRFLITLPNVSNFSGLSIRMVGNDGIAKIKAESWNLPKAITKTVLATLPGLWLLEELVAIPHIGYRNKNFMHLECEVIFKPANPLAGPAFFTANTVRFNDK